MTPEALAALHARCFAAAPRPWTAREFEEVLAGPGMFLCAIAEGFAVGRVAGPEAELLTLAVDPEARRRGLGRWLVAGFEAEAARRGAVDAYLEVAEGNAAARALYAAAGWTGAGRRRGYYAAPGRPAEDALVLRKALAPRPGDGTRDGKTI
jgi:[ribosomal protein S18]-alanine N-acetyltransferase